MKSENLILYFFIILGLIFLSACYEHKFAPKQYADRIIGPVVSAVNDPSNETLNDTDKAFAGQRCTKHRNLTIDKEANDCCTTILRRPAILINNQCIELQ